MEILFLRSDIVKYIKTKHKTTQKQRIYIAECEFTGIKRYKVKTRIACLEGKKIRFVPSYRNLDPLENEVLFRQNPNMFSAYMVAMAYGLINVNV